MPRHAEPRRHILDSAAQIVAREGAAHLTMDRIAEVSGRSKGGVLYHFPTKQSLLDAMLQRVLDETAASVTAARGSLPDSPARGIRAWIQAERDLAPDSSALTLALLANASENPELLAPARTFVRDALRALASESDDYERDLTLWLAVEGLRLMHALELLDLDAGERGRLFARLHALAAGESK